jgi:medium-chain acyl-[acyl-carrier-protein] hydrolase
MTSRQLGIVCANDDAAVDVYGFPAAGAGASFWNAVAGAVPSTIEVAGVRLPGRESRLRDVAYRSMRDLVDGETPALAERIRTRGRPFLVIGYCSGVYTALEVVRALAGLGLPAGELLVVDPPPLPSAPADDPDLLDDEPFREYALEHLELPAEVTGNPKVFDLFRPTFRADLHLVAGYVYDGARVPCDLTILWARQASDDWHCCTDGAVRTARHDYPISPEVMAGALRDATARVL